MLDVITISDVTEGLPIRLTIAVFDICDCFCCWQLYICAENCMICCYWAVYYRVAQKKWPLWAKEVATIWLPISL